MRGNAELFEAQLEALTADLGGRPPPGPPLKPPPGGGRFDGMEARVAALEVSVKHIEADIAELKTTARETLSVVNNERVRLASLIESVNHLPSKTFVVTSVSGILVLFGVIFGVLTKMGFLIPAH